MCVSFLARGVQKEKDGDEDGLLDSDDEEDDDEEEEDFITTTIAHVDEAAYFHSVLQQAFAVRGLGTHLVEWSLCVSLVRGLRVTCLG